MQRMKRVLPRWQELAIFAVLAMVCAGIVSLCEVTQHDVWMAVLTVPLFITAAVMGLRRSPQWQPVDSSPSVESETI
jgi:Ni/Fe-hydrogenase subunit HybB-like protein